MISVEYTDDGAVAHINMCRPERANALSADMVNALLEAVDDVFKTPARLLVLSGTGPSFCGGFDLNDLEDETDASLSYRFLRLELLLQKLYYAPIYTMALAHGTVSGAGADLVASCKKRVATPDSRFRFPGIRFGILLGTRRLIDLIGRQAYNVILEQQQLDALAATQAGLITAIVDTNEWHAEIVSVSKTSQRIPEYSTRLASQLGASHGDADFGILSRSLVEPGLKHRIQMFWAQARAKAKAVT